jgi:hypothetical protein
VGEEGVLMALVAPCQAQVAVNRGRCWLGRKAARYGRGRCQREVSA